MWPACLGRGRYCQHLLLCLSYSRHSGNICKRTNVARHNITWLSLPCQGYLLSLTSMCSAFNAMSLSFLFPKDTLIFSMYFMCLFYLEWLTPHLYSLYCLPFCKPWVQMYSFLMIYLISFSLFLSPKNSLKILFIFLLLNFFFFFWITVTKYVSFYVLEVSGYKRFRECFNWTAT